MQTEVFRKLSHQAPRASARSTAPSGRDAFSPRADGSGTGSLRCLLKKVLEFLLGQDAQREILCLCDL